MRLPKPTTLALLCGAILSTLSPLSAGPRFANGDVTLQGTLQVTESSRVSPRSDSSSDTIYAFIPTLRYVRESSRINLNADLSLPMRRYESNDSLDSNSVNFNLSGNVPFGTGPRLSGSWQLSYLQGIRASYLTNRNLDSTNFRASLSSNYRLRNKISLRSGATFSDRSSNGVSSTFVNENESTTYYIGLQANQIVGTIGAYVDYRIYNRKTTLGQINQNIDDSDDGINFGVTGQLLPERWFPKLDADLSFGFASTEGRGNNSTGGSSGRNNRLTLEGHLRYPATPKSNVALTFRRSLAVTDDDRTVEQSRVNLSIDYTPRQKLSFATTVGIQSNDFIYDSTARNDDVLTASISARYSIRSNWFTTLSYNFRDSASNVVLSDYNSSQLSLSTTLSY
ncbi:hypothetical protein VDG1235_465 [Verrucomicrobiia bacterium DG1235]|nr:hypothetical protein VDG1235_465 [Verrucomicrobiae bacterium DG1235]